jgi:hypothetical protein
MFLFVFGVLELASITNKTAYHILTSSLISTRQTQSKYAVGLPTALTGTLKRFVVAEFTPMTPAIISSLNQNFRKEHRERV